MWRDASRRSRAESPPLARPSSARPKAREQEDERHKAGGREKTANTSLSARAASLSSRLSYARDVLEWACSTDDPYGALVLSTYEKAMGDLESVVRQVEQSRDAGGGVERQERFPRFRPPGPSISSGGDEHRREFEAREKLGSRRIEEDEPRPLDKLSSGRRSAAPPEPASRYEDAYKLPSSFRDKNRSRSAHEHREPSPPPPAKDPYARSSSSRRAPVPPASPSPTSPANPHKAPLPPSRPPSPPASHADGSTSPPPSAAQGIPSFSRFFKRRAEAGSPTVLAEHKEHSPLSPPSRSDGFDRPVSRTSEKSSKADHDFPRPASSSSRRHRHVPSATSEEDFAPSASAPAREKEQSRARARSFGGGPARSRSGRSEDARRALDMASAPPEPEDEEDERFVRAPPKPKEPVRLDGEKVARAVAAAADSQTLLALARVSKLYNRAANGVLYSAITVASTSQLEKLNSTLDAHPSLGELAMSLTILPLDAASPAPSPDTLIPPLQRLLSHLPNLISLDEDFTSADWDVRSLLSGEDYPLALAGGGGPRKLRRFRSARCWWEIGALFQLFTSQPELKELVLGGAAMDRDWEGQKLLSSLSSTSTAPPAKNLESLEAAQVMHEDTLAVLLRAAGGPSSALRSLRIGFQSIGSSDDDTPRASIPSALALVGSTLSHLSITAPQKGSDDTTGLLDECLAVLPQLEVLEFSESTELLPAPIGSSKTLSSLPKALRILRGRSVVSISTSRVLAMLDEPEAIPRLQEVDFVWAEGAGEELGKEPWFKERHVARIEEAGEELGIRCRVKKGDEALVLGRK
ncbi:hypothetical protein JCM10213_002060 [Rhodosporidiobolus nylandii]